MMRTPADTFPTPDAKIAVMVHGVPGPVVAHFDGTDHDAAMAINTLIFQDANNRA
jgi:hypothetical protein